MQRVEETDWQCPICGDWFLDGEKKCLDCEYEMTILTKIPMHQKQRMHWLLNDCRVFSQRFLNQMNIKLWHKLAIATAEDNLSEKMIQNHIKLSYMQGFNTILKDGINWR